MNSIFIKHSIPGRLRLRAKTPDLALRVEAHCARLPGVLQSRCNKSCASVILVYNPEQTGRDALMADISLFLANNTPTGYGLEAGAEPLSCCTCSPPAHKDVTPLHLARFLSLSLVMGLVFTRQVLLKTAVAQSVFSPLGLISLLASVPLIKESIDHARAGRFTLEGFLAGGCALASLSGQAVTSLEIQWIQSGAETLKSWVAESSRRSISDILALTAKNTFVLRGDVEVEVPVEAVVLHDIVVLHTGEKVSVDGVVLSGTALVDDSPITGRSELAKAIKGSTVYAGSYIHQGVIHVRAECVGDRTYLARIMVQVEDSLATRAPVESVADDLARSMVRLGFCATLGTLVITGSLWRAFTVLMVMACPCATVLSARTAVSAAMSAAAKKGILVKGGRYLEEMGQADIVCFDKTGTLTTNRPRIEAICNFSGLCEDELIQWAYSAEMHNHHPVALAIRHEAQLRDIEPISHAQCDFTLGKGVKALIGTTCIHIGNRRYMDASGIDAAEAITAVAPLEDRGLTVVFLAKDTTVLAAFGFANEIRPKARRTIASLYQNGVQKIVVITGDSEKTALDLCSRLTIDECHHSVLPEEKGQIVATLRQGGAKVIMVGDGINDALALADADVGIAMSADGSDVAIEAADIALVHDRLEDIAYLRCLSQQTIRVARQNFWLATATNLGGAMAGAMGVLSPVAAGLLHIVHTLGVLANSSRLLVFSGPQLALPAARTTDRADTVEETSVEDKV